jgi:2-methylcitrate dehydratase PrpD
MEHLAQRLARWAVSYRPSSEDLALADRSLTDTVSVALAASREPILTIAAELPRAERWAIAAHILDFDDLHLPSTTHISTVCVPAALASGGGALAYLVGAGVMARLGMALGYDHYTRGWHATATAGAIGAAAATSHALGLDEDTTARALALAVSSASGVQAAFGTDGKSLQVGSATGAGVRAAQLAARGASAATQAVDDWAHLLGGDPAYAFDATPGVPDGLAIKLYPCCYALQRPIGAVAAQLAELARLGQGSSLDPSEVTRVVVRTPLSTIKPLIHSRPATGLEGKFSLEYAVASAIIDGYPGFSAFTDGAVRRPEAQHLLRLVEVETTPAGEGLLAGDTDLEIEARDGTFRSRLAMPPGSPANPSSAEQLAEKFAACLEGTGVEVQDIDWSSAPGLFECLWQVRDISGGPMTSGNGDFVHSDTAQWNQQLDPR